MSVSAHYDWVLVGLAVLIAVVGSYTALDLAARGRTASGQARRGWIATAAVTMGGSIWAMHFVAMLALAMPGMTPGYDLPLTSLSLLAAIAATGAGFALMNRPGSSVTRLIGAGTLMGLGVVAMHYIGMAGMRMPVSLRYDRLWVAVSIFIGVGAAIAALWVAGRGGHVGERVAAAVAMGAAVSGMHFAGMRAATFHRIGAAEIGGARGLSQVELAAGVAAATLAILVLALVAAMVDRRLAIAARHEADALRQSGDRFRALYKGTPLPLHALDGDACILHVSDVWLELMAYSRAEVIGHPLINFLTEASARQFRQQDWPELLARDVLDVREYKAVTRDGRFLDVLCTSRVERDEAGHLVHVLGGLNDVTERKRAEEALRQSQKIEAIGHLTGGIAHDFNNLLAVVIGNLDLLRRRIGEDDRARQLIDNALKGADRGAALTQRLLAFARRQDLRLEPVDVRQLVLGMSDMLQRSLGSMVRVEMRFPLDLPLAMADAHQLELALLNLGVNARDAMPQGGALEIAAEQVSLGSRDAEGLPPGSYIRLVLDDTGVGMDGDTLARAIEPFFTTKAKGQGTGLGLSMVQGVTAQSGGRLTLRSTPGRGTSVELWLPVAATAPVSVPGDLVSAPRGMEAGLPRTILAVDDDALVLSNTVATLEDLGHDVVSAGSGEEALRLLALTPAIDLVVTDQLMPGLTGTQLRERLRMIAPHLPVLLVSGFADLAGQMPADVPLLSKPFSRAALAQAVNDMPRTGSVVSISSARRAG